jgi:hypothetical protein
MSDRVQCTSKEQSLYEGRLSNDIRLELPKSEPKTTEEAKHARTVTAYLSNLPQEEYDRYELGGFYELNLA